MSDTPDSSTGEPQDGRPLPDQQLIDIVARLIDARFQSPDDAHLTPQQKLESRFKQVPPSVEYAVVQDLRRLVPEVFSYFDEDRFPNQSYIDVTDDLADRGPYYQGPSFLVDYAFGADLASRIVSERERPSLGPIPHEVDQWMKDRGLFEPSEEHPDPHFAERAFVVNVFVPAFGVGALSFIKPQKHIAPYIVDFELLTTLGPVIIEVDGREYHDRSRIGVQRFEYELERQNDLQSRGLRVFRYPARRILQEPQTVIDELVSHVLPSSSTQQTLFSQAEDDVLLESIALVEEARAASHFI